MFNTAQEYIDTLENSASPEAQYKLREGTATPEVWLELIRHHPELRRNIASSKALPEVVIRELAADPDDAVRSWIAAKRRTPPDVLELLAHDSSARVRLQVATNRKTPRHVLQQLKNDPWSDVVEAASQRLGDSKTVSRETDSVSGSHIEP